MMSLSDLLTGLTSGALTVPIVTLIIDRWFAKISTNKKAILAYIASFLLGTLGWFALIWYRQIPLPATPQLLIEALWPVWFAAYTSHQTVLRMVKTIRPGNDN